jgi:hypothetical protein
MRPKPNRHEEEYPDNGRNGNSRGNHTIPEEHGFGHIEPWWDNSSSRRTRRVSIAASRPD